MSSEILQEDKTSHHEQVSLYELQRVRHQYLELIKRCLTGLIYEDSPLDTFGQTSFDRAIREVGLDWPSQAHTMIGVKRLDNLQALVESVLGEDIKGDLIETGVWRGGACILMAAVLRIYGHNNRRVYVADSFSGLPEPNPSLYPQDDHSDFHTYPELAVSLDEVKRNFVKYGLLGDNIVFVPGFFQDTLPNLNIDAIAILRLDGDMYESTIVALRSLYHRVSQGGYIIIDDYHVVEACRAAVHDFIREASISVNLAEIDGVGVYWKK